MPLLTLQTSTTYNLKNVMDGTTASIASHTDSATFKSGLVSRLILKVPTGSPGNVKIARNYAAIDANKYDLSLTPGDSFMDVLQEEGNMINMAEFSIIADASNTLLEVYAVPF